MIFRTSKTVYAESFIALFVGLPALYLGAGDEPLVFRVAVASAALVLFIAGFIRIGWSAYYSGLESQSVRFSSGCANLTILYIFPVLFAYHVVAVWVTAVGLRKPKSATQTQWITYAWYLPAFNQTYLDQTVRRLICTMCKGPFDVPFTFFGVASCPSCGARFEIGGWNSARGGEVREGLLDVVRDRSKR